MSEQKGYLAAVGAIGSLLAGIAAVVGLFVLRAQPAPAPVQPPAESQEKADPTVVAPPTAPRSVDTTPTTEFPFFGHWTGAILQPDASSHPTYSLIVSMYVAQDDRLAGEVDYPDLHCGGVWLGAIGSARTPGPWRVEEIIQRNPSSCVPVYLELSMRDDGGIDVAIRQNPDSDVVATGSLFRVN